MGCEAQYIRYKILIKECHQITSVADYVVQFTSDLQKDANLEVQQLEETNDPWILFTDGASNIRAS